jgi:uncharacterized protein (TIGR03435 family)
MRRISNISSGSRKLLLGAAGMLASAAAALSGLAIVMPSSAQSQSQNAGEFGPEFKYEVAAIKLDKSGAFRLKMDELPDGLTFVNVPFMLIFRLAYRPFNDQIIGAPSWFNSDRYDLSAKMDASVAAKLENLSPDQRKRARAQMLRELLEDRFKLKVHRETKEVKGYSLVLANNGVKLKEAKPGDTYPDGIRLHGTVTGAGQIFTIGDSKNPGAMTITSQGTSIASLAGALTQQLRYTIVDKTGLTGIYDFKLEWTPAPDSSETVGPYDGLRNVEHPAVSYDPTGFPYLPKALQQQLGLKLESGKVSGEIIVVDHVERSSEN